MKIRKTAKKENVAKTVDAPLYEIMMQDEYNDLYLLGFYESLGDAIEDINSFISVYDEDGAIPLKKEDLAEYASTFGPCFDREIEWKNEDDCPGSVMIRGFILSAKIVGEEANRILAAHAKAAEAEEE